MIRVDEALALVREHALRNDPVRIAARDALGLTLAEDVTSDVDSPPHDKSMVDGYAVLAADLAGGPAPLTVQEEVTAGAVPTLSVSSGSATRIMTGAPLPAGADAVVMVERTALIAASDSALAPRVQIQESPVATGQNIMRRGTSLRCGQQVLSSGCRVRPIEIGLLAEVGRTEIAVYRRPSVAVLATGNELVPAEQLPAASQIRNSNSPMLAAQVTAAGAVAIDLGIARDTREALCERIARGLEADVLVLSGGVSAGVLDLVPSVLAELGVREVFHKVHLKPGKPLWFGVHDGAGRRRLVFGLPGNPVGSLVCFELFVRPALAQLSGASPARSVLHRAALLGPFRHRGDRPTYHPAVLREADLRVTVETLPWHGSADLCTLTRANCLAIFPAGDRSYAVGEEVQVHLLDETGRGPGS